ncbi:hypothetical protein EZV73_13265 [Acidaminobacter sp. JC074]|uniref:hypothetical protein n=1 Tax=Acidaminobacter sp. JC074 TaxID=2530199 RepID=UPI001F0EFA74|nr:hypothetical protein [Acidaminobacter sp. JC074]MCH4888556.1 hypothetical protein [Acidaminobacter sp. JC074]
MNKKGITIYEVIIVTALLSIIVLLTFSLILYVSRSIGNVQDQYETQTDARLVLDTTVDKIRLATSMEIITVDQAEADIIAKEAFDYIYVKEDTLYYYEYNSTKDDKYDIMLIPFYHDDTNKVFTEADVRELKITITTSRNATSQMNEVIIHLKNLEITETKGTINDTSDGTGYNAIRFTKP